MFVEVESASAGQLSRVLESAVSAGGLSLVVDFGASQSASADLLALLHRTASHLHRHGGRLAVVSAEAGLRRLMDVTLLSQAFAVFATRDEALRSWN